jgi:pimeloyl-ACP methyl ester carboxylesterase
MAARGFVALSVGYDNTGVALFADAAGQAQQMNCLFNEAEPESLISRACASLDRVDCNLGIATWGHSQGGRIALRAVEYAPRDANGNSRVRAAVAFSVGPEDRPISMDPSRVRVVDSIGDFTLPSFAPMTPADLILLTGAPPADCPESPDQCLRADKRAAGCCWATTSLVSASATAGS